MLRNRHSLLTMLSLACMGLAAATVGCHNNNNNDGGTYDSGQYDSRQQDAASQDAGTQDGFSGDANTGGDGFGRDGGGDGFFADGGRDGYLGDAFVMLTDAQIAAITADSNNGEIQEAQLAVSKTSSMLVKQFANQMISDHMAMNQQQQTVLGMAGISPMENSISMHLTQEAMQTMTTLQAKTGAEFDRAYADSQVAAHQEVLNLFDAELLPQVKNAQFKTLLQNSRSVISTHLNMSMMLRAMLP